MSTLAAEDRFGKMIPFNNSLNCCGCEIGKNCARVVIARLRTAMRVWKSRGVKTESGDGLKFGSERYDGKRMINMERIDNVSMRVSGGMSDYTQVSTLQTYASVTVTYVPKLSQ